MPAAASQPRSGTLPELRQELRLHAGPRNDGSIDWLVYDPVRHRYFHVSRAAFELLERWRKEPADRFIARASADLDRAVAIDDVNEVTKFLIANNLALDPPSDDARALAAQESSTRRSPIARVVHGYLFFKVPLVRPERFLAATMPLVAPLYTRTAALLIALVTLAGVYLTSRQWEAFVATFMDFLSLEGVFVYAVSLIVIKALHELGHAYTATRVGVRVNTMGVAFMVMTPLLYTDVTDAWRLRDRKDKLAINGAGIVVELALAGAALFLWAFLPDGPWRSAAFVTATTSLVLGLIVNLNPLMRFDGYYLLADAWRVPNLQPRSNALARWWLRELLFGFGHPPPETVPARKRALLVGYAFAVWIYRFFLFIGIALLVYHLFFKVLGVVLFVIEIIWFILLPVAREMKEWWAMRTDAMKTRRTLVSVAILASAVAILVVPWSGTVTMQGVALSDLETRIFASRPGRVASIQLTDASIVTPGQRLLVLDAPDLNHEISQTRKRIALAEIRLLRIAGDTDDRANRVVLEGELAREKARLGGLEAELERLIVRAPHAGMTRDVDRQLAPGEWIDEATPVARIVATRRAEVRAYIKEDDLWRLGVGAVATFVPEDPLMARRDGRIVDVASTGIRAIELPYLASVYGGTVPSDRAPDHEIRPRAGWHQIRVALDGPPVPRAIRGTLHVTAARESLLSAMWRRVLQVLVRESSA